MSICRTSREFTVHRKAAIRLIARFLTERLIIQKTKDIMKVIDAEHTLKDLFTYSLLKDLVPKKLSDDDDRKISSNMSDGRPGQFVMADKFIVLCYSKAEQLYSVHKHKRVSDILSILRIKKAALGDGFLTKRGDVFWTVAGTPEFHFRTPVDGEYRDTVNAILKIVKTIEPKLMKAKTMRDINNLVEDEANRTGLNFLKYTNPNK